MLTVFDLYEELSKMTLLVFWTENHKNVSKGVLSLCAINAMGKCPLEMNLKQLCLWDQTSK